MILWFKRAVFITIMLALILWMVANRQLVTVSFSPLPYQWEIPLYIVLFAGIFLGLLVAGIVTSLKRAEGALERQRMKREKAQLITEKHSLEDALNEQFKQNVKADPTAPKGDQARLGQSSS